MWLSERRMALAEEREQGCEAWAWPDISGIVRRPEWLDRTRERKADRDMKGGSREDQELGLCRLG